MKNKLYWFDDNRNWDVRPTRVLYELLLSPTYRWPMQVKAVCSYKQYFIGSDPDILFKNKISVQRAWDYSGSPHTEGVCHPQAQFYMSNQGSLPWKHPEVYAVYHLAYQDPI